MDKNILLELETEKLLMNFKKLRLKINAIAIRVMLQLALLDQVE